MAKKIISALLAIKAMGVVLCAVHYCDIVHIPAMKAMGVVSCSVNYRDIVATHLSPQQAILDLHPRLGRKEAAAGTKHLSYLHSFRVCVILISFLCYLIFIVIATNNILMLPPQRLRH